MRRFGSFIIAAFVAIAGAGTGVIVASATKPDPGHKVTICHATASQTRQYVVETVDIASIESFVSGSGHGASGVNANDIIPGFSYAGPPAFVFPGLNLGYIASYTIGGKTVTVGASGASIFANGCKVPTSTPPPGGGGGNGGGGNGGGGGTTGGGTTGGGSGNGGNGGGAGKGAGAPKPPTTGVGDADGA